MPVDNTTVEENIWGQVYGVVIRESDKLTAVVPYT